MASSSTTLKSEDVLKAVTESYGAIAKNVPATEQQRESAAKIAKAFGYTHEELEVIPKTASLGLSCGNPTALAALKEGETVVDLGSGGGMDVFLASKKVGPKGHVVGIDMTMEMIALARSNAKKNNFTNVEFLLAEINRMPLPDNCVDCVISNCVLNLVPDKVGAFKEIFRILKPGGRLAVSDICLRKELPAKIANSLRAVSACIAGASTMQTYRQLLQSTGFTDSIVVDKHLDLNAYRQNGGSSGCCGTGQACGGGGSGSSSAQPTPSCCGGSSSSQSSTSPSCGCGGVASNVDKIAGDDLKDIDLNEYAASCNIWAIKPQKK